MRGGPLVLVAVLASCRGHAPDAAELGKKIFFDPSLSSPAGQACADCHAPHVAFRDPESDHTTSSGALTDRYGARNAPSIMYARFVPDLHREGTAWVGGMFWDGRAASFEAQAGVPMLNPVEMNNPDKATVVEAVRHAAYAGDFRRHYGEHALDDVEKGFAFITDAIAAYERTRELAPYSSKYDRALRHEVELTAAEKRGLAIFEDPKKGNCAACHPAPLFTNFTYANLGIPKYTNNRYYRNAKDLNPSGAEFLDHGLMTTVNDPAQDGKFRVPSLRNIARTGPYGHNGYFENLAYMLDFLNTRDSRSPDPEVKPWATPEIAVNVDPRVGHLGLSAAELADLQAFLETLTDELPKPPPPEKNPRKRR